MGGDDQTKKKPWNKIRAAKDLLGLWGRYVAGQKKTQFNPTPENVAKTGISASALLSVMNEEQFMTLERLWKRNCKGGPAYPMQFLSLFRTLLVNLIGVFDDDGTFAGRTQPSRNNNGKLSDLENYVKELFVAVDTQRQQQVTWDDFVSYLITNVMTDSSTNPLKVAKRLTDTSYSFTGCLLDGSEDRKDSYTALRFCPGLNKMFATSKKRVSMVDCDGPASRRADHFDHAATVLSVETMPCYKYLLTSCSDFRVRVWNIPSATVVSDMIFPRSIRALRWCGPNHSSCAFLGDRDGHLFLTDLTKLSTSEPNVVSQYRAKPTERCKGALEGVDAPFVQYQVALHSASITDLVVMPNENCVTVGVDSNMYIVNPHRGYAVTHFDTSASPNAHKHGIYSVAHVDNYRFLITAGVEPHALVWVDNMPSIPCFKLSDPNSPHAAPLCSVCPVPSTPHVMTIDVLGSTKIFDIRTFQLLESFNMKNHVEGAEDLFITSAAHTGNRNRQLVYSSRELFVFEHESKASEIPRMAHTPEQSILATAYLKKEARFVTISSKEVRLWNADSGALDKTYSNLTQSAITAGTVDARTPAKMLLGHQDGLITAVGVLRGDELNKYKKHNSKIIDISLNTRNDFFVSSAVGGHVNVWYDLNPPIAFRGLMKAKAFPTFTDEVAALQNPAAAVSNMLMPSKSGENSQAAKAALEKMKKLVLARAAKQHATDIMAEARASKKDPPAHPTPETKPVQSWKKPKSTRPRQDTDPVARLSFPVECVSVSFHPDAPSMLLATASRLAFVYDVTSFQGPSFRAPQRIGHSDDTELCGGHLLAAESLALTADTEGIIHMWDLRTELPVCLSRWYSCNPPRPAPTAYVLADEVSPDDVTCVSYRKHINAATDLLSSLAVAGPNLQTVASVVPTISRILWVGPCFIYVANEIGFITVWDLSYNIKESESRERQAARKDLFVRRDRTPINLPSLMTPHTVLSWSAHDDAVVDMVHVQVASCLITAGADMKVHLWSMGGACLGSLKQGPLLVNHFGFTGPQTKSGMQRIRARAHWKCVQRSVAEGCLRLGQNIIDPFQLHALRLKRPAMASCVFPKVSMRRSMARQSMCKPPLCSSPRAKAKSPLVALGASDFNTTSGSAGRSLSTSDGEPFAGVIDLTTGTGVVSPRHRTRLNRGLKTKCTLQQSERTRLDMWKAMQEIASPTSAGGKEGASTTGNASAAGTAPNDTSAGAAAKGLQEVSPAAIAGQRIRAIIGRLQPESRRGALARMLRESAEAAAPHSGEGAGRPRSREPAASVPALPQDGLASPALSSQYTRETDEKGTPSARRVRFRKKNAASPRFGVVGLVADGDSAVRCLLPIRNTPGAAPVPYVPPSSAPAGGGGCSGLGIKALGKAPQTVGPWVASGTFVAPGFDPVPAAAGARPPRVRKKVPAPLAGRGPANSTAGLTLRISSASAIRRPAQSKE